MGVDEELRSARGESTLAIHGTESLGRGAEEEQATGSEREGLVSGDVDRIAGDIAHAQAVQGRIDRDGDGAGDRGVDADIVGRRGEGDGVGRRGQVGVGPETVGAERGDAESRDRGGEVAGADDGPTAEDAAREAGVRQRRIRQIDSVEVTDHDAGRGTDDARGAVKVDGTPAGDAIKAGDVELGRTAGDAGASHIEEGVRRGQSDRTDQFRVVRLLATAEFDESATHGDGRGVVEAVVQADGAGVLEIQAAVVDLDRGGVDQAGVVAEQDAAAVDDGGARVGVRRVQVGVLRARTGELHVALDRTGPITGIVVVVIEEVSRGGGAVRHDGVVGVIILVTEDGIEELRAAVEVQRAADERGEVVGLDGVRQPGAEAHGTFVEHELAAEGVRSDGRETHDRRGRRIEHEGARARLDHRDAGVGSAVAAVDRGVDRQHRVTDRPDVEMREARRLVEHAAGDRRRAAVADQDAAR